MVNTIKQKLDNYLGFNSDELFIDEFVRIFGGAIRDSISGDKINDIDILCGAKSCHILEGILEENGYKYFPSMLTTLEIGQIYKINGVINEPHTWIKGDNIVQLIRPVVASNMSKLLIDKTPLLRDAFIDLIANVDISCCGISYDSKNIYENYPNAILHAQERIFKVNNYAKMYVKDRITYRRVKFQNRGWEEIKDDKVDNRDIKIISLLNPITFEYVREYETYTKSFSQSYLDEDMPF